MNPLSALPGQPLCRYYTGASLDHQSGDYSCRCLAGVPYDRWCPVLERWPCRRRHILGVEQHSCEHAEYGVAGGDLIDEQVTEMALRAISTP